MAVQCNDSIDSNCSSSTCLSEYQFNSSNLPKGIPRSVSVHNNKNPELTCENTFDAELDYCCTDELDESDNEALAMLSDVMQQKSDYNLISNYSDERGILLESIRRLGSHIPECVLSELNQEIIILTQIEKQRQHDEKKLQNKMMRSDSTQESLFFDNEEWKHISANKIPMEMTPPMRKEPMSLPYATRHTSALLFVDISGFTKLSTLLSVENLSKAINSYFQLIVNEVTAHGGDIIKFAGDALFAEWRATKPYSDVIESQNDVDSISSSKSAGNNTVRDSLDPWHGMHLNDCATVAATCGSKIVATCSDYPILDDNLPNKEQGSQVASLNVHCGIGVGEITGVHVGDQKRREYLIIGDPIDQVTLAEEMASLGELVASPQVMAILRQTCTFEDELLLSPEEKPAVIASRSRCFFWKKSSKWKRRKSIFSTASGSTYSRPPAEDLAVITGGMDMAGLKILRKLISAYVHPVVVNDEFEKKSYRRVSMTNELLEQDRHRAEAQLRNVCTLFIMPKIKAKIMGTEEDEKLFNQLNNIMNSACAVLDRFKGHLRQFIVDDKGVVLIATFGLRGSTFPSMVHDHALPASMIIHEVMKRELGIETCVGGTIGNVYCGVIGGIKRHEYAVLGPVVNLSARLAAMPQNPGILITEAIKQQASKGFSFRSFPSVQAKGFDELIPIFQPVSAAQKRWGQVKDMFVGRRKELKYLCNLADELSSSLEPSRLAFISAESGCGKSSVIVKAISMIRKMFLSTRKHTIIIKHVGNDRDYMVPFSLFKSVFQVILREFRVQGDGGFKAFVDCDNSFTSLKMGGRSIFSSSVHTNMSSNTNRFIHLCEEMGAPQEFFQIVGHHLLGIKSDEAMVKTAKKAALHTLVKFMVESFDRCTCHADLVVLAIDDAQYMDDLSWKVVQSLFESKQKILLVCSSKPPDKFNAPIDSNFWSALNSNYMREKRFVLIELLPMSKEEILELIAKALGYKIDRIDDDFCREIFQQSGGMPDFAVQIIENVEKGNLLEELNTGCIGWRRTLNNNGQHSSSILFSDVSEIMLWKLDSLDVSVRDQLQVAAVLGTTFDLLEIVSVLEHCVGVGRFDKRFFAKEVFTFLSVVIECGILEEESDEDRLYNGGDIDAHNDSGESSDMFIMPSYMKGKSYRFTNEKWRYNILQLMLDSRKRDIHRSIALALENIIKDRDDFISTIKVFGHWKASGDTSKSSSLGLSIGRQFEELGLQNHAENIYREVLDMWKVKSNSDDDEVIAGYSGSVLDSLRCEDIEFIIKVHIARGKVLANLQRGIESVEIYQKALLVLEHAPVAEDLQDRSIIFPIYSGLFMALKFGDIEQDRECTYEQTLVKKFVSEAKRNGDPVHYTRALAMQGDMYGRLGHWEKAFESCRKLKLEYSVDEHSAGICKAYGSDRSAQIISQSAWWYIRNNNFEKAMGTCHYVLNELVPKMEPRNVHNTAVLIYPVIFILKDSGMALKAKNIFETYVVHAFHKHYGEGAFTFFLPIYKPILILLELAARDNVQIEEESEYVEWASDIENLQFKNSFEGSLGNMGRNPSSITAEICILLSKRRKDEREKIMLIKNALHLSRLSIEATKPSDKSVGMINAYFQVKPLHEEILSFARKYQII